MARLGRSNPRRPNLVRRQRTPGTGVSIATLTEDWASGRDTTKWPLVSGTNSVVSGAYAFSGASSYLGSREVYTLVDAALFAKLDVTGLTGGDTGVRMRYRTSTTSNDFYNIFLSQGTWWAAETVNDVNIGTEDSGSWDPAAEKWWCIRHDTGTGVRFQKSSDSQTWTTLKTIAAPSLNVTAITGSVEFSTAASNTATGNFLVDNINIAVAAASARLAMIV